LNDGSGGCFTYLAVDGATTLTIGAGITVRGRGGYLGNQIYTTGSNAIICEHRLGTGNGKVRIVKESSPSCFPSSFPFGNGERGRDRRKGLEAYPTSSGSSGGCLPAA
jgi:hypothetical protein